MQDQIRSTCESAMREGFERFRNLKKDNILLRPDQPGNVIAKLALQTPKELTGKFLRYKTSSPFNLLFSANFFHSWNATELAEFQE